MSMEEEGLLDDERVEELPSTLSHSSHQTLEQCEARYYFYKVLHLPHDIDANPDRYAFKFGKALHYIMELSFHDRKNFRRQMILDAIEQQELAEEDFYRLWACAMAYYEGASKSGLRVVICELAIVSPRVKGFIDGVGIDERGRFWILDLKTTGWWKDLLPLRLPRDPQLSIYTSHLAQVVEALRELGYNVDLQDFAGVAYRAVLKPRVIPRMGQETVAAYTQRAGVRCNFINILKEDMDVEGVVAEHTAAHTRAMELNRIGEDMGLIPAPRRNYSACTEYNRTCEYWSQCYGVTVSEMKKKVHIATLDNPINVSSLVAVSPTETKEHEEMLNVTVRETNWFPSEKTCRVIVTAALGTSETAPQITRPFYYETTGAIDAAWMNECIEAAMRDAKTQLWIHLSTIRSEQMYHHWCSLLGVTPIPAPKGAELKAPEATPAKEEKVEKPVANPEPKEEKPVAKPKTPPPEETEEEEEEPVAKPAAKAKAKAPKGPDETVWVAGDKALSPHLMAVLDENFPKNWKDKAKFKDLAKEISATLAKKKVVVLRDGEITEEFTAMVEKLCE